MSVEPDDIRFECPHCQKHLAGSPQLVGRVIKCPDCDNSFAVCMPPPAAPPLPPEPPQQAESKPSPLPHASVPKPLAVGSPIVPPLPQSAGIPVPKKTGPAIPKAVKVIVALPIAVVAFVLLVFVLTPILPPEVFDRLHKEYEWSIARNVVFLAQVATWGVVEELCGYDVETRWVRRTVECWLRDMKAGKDTAKYWEDLDFKDNLIAVRSWDILNVKGNSVLVQVDSSNRGGIPIRSNWRVSLHRDWRKSWKIRRISEE